MIVSTLVFLIGYIIGEKQSPIIGISLIFIFFNQDKKKLVSKHPTIDSSFFENN